MGAAKKTAFALGAVLLFGAAAGGGGWWYGRDQLRPLIEGAEDRADALQQTLEAARQQHASEAATLREELDASKGRVQVLEARRFLSVALDELDERNFGRAQQNCSLAGVRLSRAIDESGETDETVRDVAEQLSNFRLEVDSDFEALRGRLRAFSRTLDRYVAPPAADDDEL